MMLTSSNWSILPAQPVVEALNTVRAQEWEGGDEGDGSH